MFLFLKRHHFSLDTALLAFERLVVARQRFDDAKQTGAVKSDNKYSGIPSMRRMKARAASASSCVQMLYSLKACATCLEQHRYAAQSSGLSVSVAPTANMKSLQIWIWPSSSRPGYARVGCFSNGDSIRRRSAGESRDSSAATATHAPYIRKTVAPASDT